MLPHVGNDQGRPQLLASRRFLLETTADDLRDWLAERGHPAYRARQVLDWVIRRRAESFEVMSDLPLALRRELEAEWTVFSTRVAFHGTSPDGTDKLLLECHDGRRIECVLMVEERRQRSASVRRSAAAWAVSSAPAGSRASSGT